jgi:hypothetical protein
MALMGLCNLSSFMTGPLIIHAIYLSGGLDNFLHILLFYKVGHSIV